MPAQAGIQEHKERLMMRGQSPRQSTIIADQQVEDLVRDYPDVVRLLLRENIVCIECGEPYWGTIGDLLKSRHMDVEGTLATLNMCLHKKT